jgi:clan AA aspartic protease (TIGR02281 family)
MFNVKTGVFLGTFFLFLTAYACADTLYLKNGKSLEGLITKEGKGTVEINVGGGTVVFQAAEIERVERSAPGEAEAIKKDWELEKARSEMALERDREAREKASAKWEAMVEEERRSGEEKRLTDENTKIVPVVSDDHGHYFVKAVLNNEVPALLMIDTGCPTVLLTADMGRQLGINLDPSQDAREIMVLNGKYRVRGATLKNVKLDDLEENKILADVMLEDSPEITRNLKDGLLGMSFLGKYNVTLDPKKMKLIFKPRV